MTTGALGYLLTGAKILLGRPTIGPVMRWNGIGGVVPIGDSASRLMSRLYSSLGATVETPPAIGDVLYHHPVHGDWRVVI